MPLNDRLERSTAPAAEARAAYERPWLRLNAVRVVAATAALVLQACAVAAL